jgi:hypothetical protein
MFSHHRGGESRMRRLSIWAGVAALAAAGIAPAAQAVINYSVTYTGVVTSGQGVGVDFASVFGNGAALVGKPVSLVFTIEGTKVDPVFGSNDGFDRFGPVHAEGFDVTSKSLDPAQIGITASVRIGDITADIVSSAPVTTAIDQVAATRSFTDTFSSKSDQLLFFDNATGFQAGAGASTGFGTPYDVFRIFPDTALSYDTSGDASGGIFTNNIYTYPADFFSVNFSVSNVTITRLGGVPEPVSWATMIAGLGVAGAGLRTRRRTPVPA